MIDLPKGALALLLALTGCDGVGRALVETAPRGEADNLPCDVVECRDLSPTALSPLRTADLDPRLSSCLPDSAAGCDPMDETMPVISRPPPGVCQRTFSLDDDAFDPEALRTLSCSKLRLTRTQSGPSTVLRLEDVAWSRLEVEVESAVEVSLELVRADLKQVQVRLRGPVTLRVVDSPEIAGMALATDSADATADFRVSVAETVRVGSAEAQFAGSLTGTQSALQHVELFARDVRLEIAELADALIEAHALQIVDVSGRRSRLAFDEGLIAASTFTDVDVERCGALRLYDTAFAGFRIPSCTRAATRAVGASFRKGRFDGDILADGADFRSTVFGLDEPTDLQLWDTTMSSVNFCANTDRIVLGGKVSAECALCREMDGGYVPIDACTAEDARPMLLKCCPVLDLIEPCRPDADRMRPPFN